MAVQFTQYSAEELAQRGQEIYEREIRPHVEADNFGKVVAIDVRTGAYELGDDAITTTSRLRLRFPEAEIWLVRVGHLAYRSIGRRRGYAIDQVEPARAISKQRFSLDQPAKRMRASRHRRQEFKLQLGFVRTPGERQAEA